MTNIIPLLADSKKFNGYFFSEHCLENRGIVCKFVGIWKIILSRQGNIVVDVQ